MLTSLPLVKGLSGEHIEFPLPQIIRVKRDLIDMGK